MFDPALVKLLLLSLSMVGALRLFVILFLGDLQRDPAIKPLCRAIAKMAFSHPHAEVDVANPSGSAPPAPGQTAC